MNVSTQEREPTPGQLRYIALLSSKLGIQEPHVHTFGEAGRMINELKRELAHRNAITSNRYVNAVYSVLTRHKYPLRYEYITDAVNAENPMIHLTRAQVLNVMNTHRDVFVRVSEGVYYVKNGIRSLL